MVVAGAVLARLTGAGALAWLGAIVAAVVAGAGIVRAVRRPIGPYETARRTDAALGLRERLATALELLDEGADGPVPRAQVQDAVTLAGRLRPRQAFPFFPRGSAARRLAVRDTGLAVLALAMTLLFALWPWGAQGPLQGVDDRRLVVADPARREEQQVAPERLLPGQRVDEQQPVEALSSRPDQVGDPPPGLVGSNPQQAAPQNPQGDPGSQSQRGQQDAASQSNPNVAARQEALQDLANALRQSQTARQAADSLRRGDTQRASEQLNQVADQVNRLSPGERQSLAQAFQQASQQIGSKDRALSDAARRAGEALEQFRNRDAQQAIRDTANQVRDIGQQAAAQREAEARRRELERGGQPQLAQGQQSQSGQQGQQGQQGSSAQQAGAQTPGQQGANQPRQGGDAAGSGALSELEAALRGGLDAASSAPGAGSGAGTGEGGSVQGAPSRLDVQARLVQVEAELREGPTVWRPPSPNSPPAVVPPPAAPLPGAPASAQPVGTGLDLNNVPWDMAGPVRQYFTPDQPRP